MGNADSGVEHTKAGEHPDPKKTRLEKVYLVLLVLAFLVIIGLVIAVIIFSLDKKDNSGVCTTKQCITAASNLFESVDFTVDPCEDFYQYACGNWKKKHVIPEDRSSFTTFTKLREEISITLRGLIEEDVDDEPEAIKKARVLYKSCINETLLEERNMSVIFPLLSEVGSWPLLTPSWNPNAFSLTNTLVKLRRINNRPIINMYVSTDSGNSSKYIIYIDQPGFGMPGRKYLIKGKDDVMVKAYEKYAGNIAIELGANPRIARRDVRDMVDFEIKLAHIVAPREERRDPVKLYNKMTIRELQRNFTGFDWYRYLRNFFSSKHINLDITLNEEVVVQDPEYFRKVIPLLQSTNKRIIANYIIWRLVNNRAYNLPRRFTEHITNYKRVIYGMTSPQPRWEKCVSYTTSSIGQGVGRLFVKDHFNNEARDTMMYMIRFLRDAMKELVEDLDWMDSDTKPLAMEKADAMGELIGFPENPNILDDTELNKLYENLTYNEDTYFENVLENLRWYAIDYSKRLRDTVDDTRWMTAPSTVNAFYRSGSNSIMFPAGILQPPYYHKDQPMSMNFGGIGTVIGHEITHGFDDSGRKYDKEGNLRQWWNDDVIEEFKDRAQCIIDQYGQYKPPETDINLNGITTQGENIADNGGVKQSFRAYQNWVEENGEEHVLPGLNFSQNQLFFLNFGQVWCNNFRREGMLNRILTGAHSPGRFRVIGPLQNLKDFSDSFNCKAGTYMNPSKKCSVW